MSLVIHKRRIKFVRHANEGVTEQAFIIDAVECTRILRELKQDPTAL